MKKVLSLLFFITFAMTGIVFAEVGNINDLGNYYDFQMEVMLPYEKRVLKERLGFSFDDPAVLALTSGNLSEDKDDRPADLAKLVKSMSKRISNNPKDVDALFLRGVCKLLLLKQNDAYQDFDNAHLNSLDDAKFLNAVGLVKLIKGDKVAAGLTLTNAIQKAPDFAPSYLNLGMLFYATAQYDAAAKQFEIYVTKATDDIYGLVLLAKAYAMETNLDKALEVLDKAIERDISQSMAWWEKGKVSYAMSKFEDSDLFYRIAMTNRNDMEIALFNRKFTEKKVVTWLGILKQAGAAQIYDYNNGAIIYHDEFFRNDIDKDRANGIQKYFNNNIAEATQLFKRSSEEYPDYVEPWLFLADVHEKNHAWDAALAEYNTLIKFAPSCAYALYRRAMIEKTYHSKYQEAFIDLDRAVKLMPENGNIHCGRAVVLCSMDKPDEAILSIHEALAKGCDDLDGIREVGLYFQDKNRCDITRECYNYILAHYKNLFEEYWHNRYIMRGLKCGQ